MIGLVVPSNDPNLLQLTGTASQSPFVIAARRQGSGPHPQLLMLLSLLRLGLLAIHISFLGPGFSLAWQSMDMLLQYSKG